MDILIASYSSRLLSGKRPIRSAFIVVCLLMGMLLVAAATGLAQEMPLTETPETAAEEITPRTPAPSQAPSVPRHLKARSLKKRTRVINKTTREKAENIASEITEALPERLENEIKKYFGLRYRWGGSGNNGIDCSALTRKVYADLFGIDLPRNSTEQSRSDMMDIVAKNDLQTGDLLFFGPRRKRVNHVGIYLAGGYFLHAARSEGVTISRLDNSYWKSRWMLSKRIKDLPTDSATAGGRDLESAMAQFSLGLAFAGETTAQDIHFLDGGIHFNDTSELRLSASYKQNLNATYYDAEQQWPLTLRPQAYAVDSESRLRLSAVLSPLPMQGFKLVPSITQIVDGRNRTNLNRKTQTLGLETWMTLPSSGLALFMGAQAKSREDLLQRPLKMAPDWQTLDLSLGVYYRFSNALRFSLQGIHSYDTKLDGDTESGRQPIPLLDDISFKLDYRF